MWTRIYSLHSGIPVRKLDRLRGKEHWSEQVCTALEAWRLGIELRRGKPKSFRPTIGTAF
ncbi:hypothetical protein DDD63_01020 [Actinobaculum sp. 313]|nr:hypothetical protein DDD63_01020 [Actinobaculum sp. 313]